MDAVATVLVIGAVAGGLGASARAARIGRTALAAGIIAIAVARGIYIFAVEHAERSLFSLHLRPTPWTEAMRWMAAQPIDAHVLADSGHAWKYGTSVRVAAGRDVFLEETKDAAIAIYSRDVALRVVERTRALGGDLARLDTAAVRAIGERYGITHVVTEGHLDLPLYFENAQFRIYGMPPATRLASVALAPPFATATKGNQGDGKLAEARDLRTR